jgi:general stress protein YciG
MAKRMTGYARAELHARKAAVHGKGRGFASMDPAQQRAIASLGGRAATQRHRWTTEEAQVWGRKGGSAPKRPRRP